MSIIDRADRTSLDSWHEVVSALPVPAALVDRDGRVVTANQQLRHVPGDRLVDMADVVDGVSPGVKGDTLWRIAQLRQDDLIYLATAQLPTPTPADNAETADPSDPIDHMLGRFFAPTNSMYVVADSNGRALEWNEAWSSLLGMDPDEISETNLWDLLLVEDQGQRADIEQELLEHGRAKPALRIRAADGGYTETQWVLMFDQEHDRCYGVGRGGSATRRQDGELQRRANSDDLTGLASRSHTITTLASHLDGGNGVPAILFCDLDQFKVVNDSLGHAVGDRLLASLAERLTESLDSPEITVGRLGGDEFAIVLADGGLAAAEAAAERAFEAVSRDFPVGGRSVRIGMSIGICVAENDAPTSAELMFERADMAVYKAKEDGRNRTVVFGPELQERVDRQFELEAALRNGLENAEFEPWFQPVMSIQTGQIVGVEALLRWYRSSGEVLTPGFFLDVAIETGLIAPIGRQMIAAALSEFGNIGESINQEIFLTLNVSARELMDDGFTEWFVDRVAFAAIRPSEIVLEITESIAIEEQELSDQLTVLRALGFRIALDDFGTGHSSLAHLRTLPIDIVKIDRSFVADLVDDSTTSALTRSIVDLCAALGLMVIFEGVETQEESLAVVLAGGMYAQGFLHARPMPVSELQWQTVSAALARRLGAREQINPTS